MQEILAADFCRHVIQIEGYKILRGFIAALGVIAVLLILLFSLVLDGKARLVYSRLTRKKDAKQECQDRSECKKGDFALPYGSSTLLFIRVCRFIRM